MSGVPLLDLAVFVFATDVVFRGDVRSVFFLRASVALSMERF